MPDRGTSADGPAGPGPAQPPVRVMVVDDHDLFRSGLRRLLDGEPGLEVVAEARNGDEAVRRAVELRLDVVVMDINMPGMSGIEATRMLLEASPASSVMMLTVSDADGEILDSLLAGASGYVLKDATLPEIVAAIFAVAAGDAPLAPRIASRLVARLRRHGRDERPHSIGAELSPRELDVLRLLVGGCDNIEIGRHLHLSSSTVKHHVSSILDKLGVQNRIQAAVLAVRGGLVDERAPGGP